MIHKLQMAHLIGHVTGVSITDAKVLEKLMDQVAEKCNFSVVARAFHQFEPYGATGVLVLSESHFSAHTYPEDKIVYIDVFCCSHSFDPEECSRVILNIFGASDGRWQVVQRR
jgi:S-adenosylmethionine decarboxylase proenzyme